MAADKINTFLDFERHAIITTINGRTNINELDGKDLIKLSIDELQDICIDYFGQTLELWTYSGENL